MVREQKIFSRKAWSKAEDTLQLIQFLFVKWCFFVEQLKMLFFFLKKHNSSRVQPAFVI